MVLDHISVPFHALSQADLVVDAVYGGGTAGSVADDPLQRLLPVGNQGGFRYKGSPSRDDVRVVVLYTSGENPDWPDTLDEKAGIFWRLAWRGSRMEQLPQDRAGQQILEEIRTHFADRWIAFEACAVALWRMLAPATAAATITRPSRDHGRDAIGIYQLGPAADRVSLDFALEAKCYAASTSVGVRETSRLISRIRHRMFGVLVTTSYVNDQAYREIREDQHPIVVVCGKDNVDILKSHGYTSPGAARAWLNSAFPSPVTSQLGSP